MFLLAQTRIEDVFKSTGDSLNDSADTGKLLAFVLALVSVIFILVIFNNRRKREATPKALRHQGKLLREVLRKLPLRSQEVKQLKLLAEQQECHSPLVMLLCPSLLARAMQDKSARLDRRVLGRIAKKMGMLQRAVGK